jgi:hypothetical protein
MSHLLKEVSEDKKFYVYSLTDPEGKTFYIGKGNGQRIKAHRRDAKKFKHSNKYVERVINKIWSSDLDFSEKILFDNLTESEAFEAEIRLISEIGLDNLCNFTAGGEGTTGMRHSEEARKRMSLVRDGTKNASSKLTEEQVIEIRNSNFTNRFFASKYNLAPESVSRIRKGMVYKNIGGKIWSEEEIRDNAPKTHSEEAKRRMSEKCLGKKQSDETRKLKSLLRQGTSNPASKLTNEQVLEIRNNNSPTSFFMEKFNISRSAVLAIRNGATYKDVGGKIWTHEELVKNIPPRSFSKGITKKNKNPRAKLNEKLVWEIKFGKYKNHILSTLSELLSVSISVIYDVRHNITWKHVTYEYT